MLLAIEWGVVGVKVAQLLLSLSILVVLHEFGHYITAKWFGCRVEKFYLFFDPWFALYKKKIGETEYGIGWLPLGGYVKIAGMIDESMDKEQLKKPPQPWEFRSKPAWQRLIIMLGGIIVNVLTAFFIYSMILMVWGKSTIPVQSLKYGIAVQDTLLYTMGLKDGDNILEADGKPITDFNQVMKKVLVAENLTVLRNGQTQIINLPVDLIGSLVENKGGRNAMILPRSPVIVEEVVDSMAAAKAGIQPGDQIIALNNQPTPFFDQFKRAIIMHPNDSVNITLLRGADTLNLFAKTDVQGRLGFQNIMSMEALQKAGVLSFSEKKYGFFEAIPAGIKMAIDQLLFYIDQFKKILSPETGAYKGVGGFKSMGKIFPAVWDWESFWNITAFFSIILAFMNLLPIPALDGGHVMFTLLEMITGRKPSERFMEFAQLAGMVILLGLMVFANGNDWFGWGK